VRKLSIALLLKIETMRLARRNRGATSKVESKGRKKAEFTCAAEGGPDAGPPLEGRFRHAQDKLTAHEADTGKIDL